MTEHDEIKPNEKVSVNDLEETYRKFLRLYERFAADRLMVVKQGETLCKIMEELKAEADLATEFKVHVRQDVVETIKKATAEINEQLKTSIQNVVTSEFTSSLQELKVATDNSVTILKKYTEEKEEKSPWISYLMFFMGLTVFFAILYIAITVRKFTPESYLTRDQLVTYSNGEYWEGVARRISKKEQDRLMDFYLGKTPPEKGSVEGIKRSNPNLSWSEIKKKFNEQKE